MREHDAAGTYADAGLVSAPMRARMNLRRGGGEGLHGVMLGDPEAAEAKGFDMLGEGDGVVQGLRGRGAGGDRRLIEDGEAESAHGDWMNAE